jgi:CRP-like cAMP-binding protein
VGELGFLAPDNRRTQSLECTEDGQVLAITYDRLLEIYFQNPEFGYYFLRLSTERLLQNIARLEGIIDQYKAQAASVKENQADSGKQD